MEDKKFKVSVFIYDEYQEEVVTLSSLATREEIKGLIRTSKKNHWDAFIGIRVLDEDNHKEHVYFTKDRAWKSYTAE